MLKKRQKWWAGSRLWVAISVGGTALFSLAASCGAANARVSFADANFIEVRGQYQPFTSASLLAAGKAIPGELVVPWRRGVAYEALSQTFSFVRALAIQLGWSEAAFEKQAQLITLDADDTTLAGVKSRYQPVFSTTPGHRATDFDLIIADLLKVKHTAPLTAWQQRNAVLGIGSDAIDGNIYARDFYNVTFDGINLQDTRYGEIKALKTDIVSALDAHPVRITPLADPATPGAGLLHVRVYNTPYARMLPLVNLSPLYPVLDETQITAFVPLVQELMASLVAYFHAPEIAPFFDDRLVPPFIIDIVNFFQNVWTRFSPNGFTEQITQALRALNNGAFHFLAIEAFVRGLAGDLFTNDDDQPVRATVNVVNGVDANRGLPGISAMAIAPRKSVNDFLPYARFPTIVTGPATAGNEQLYTYIDNPQQRGYLAYFLDREQDLLVRNGVKRTA